MKILKKIFLVCTPAAAAIVILNYAVYLCHLIVFPEQPLAFIITFLALALTVLPIVFRKKLEVLLKRAYRPLRAIWSAALILYAVTFSAMVVFIFAGKGAEVPPEDMPERTVLIVYGAKVGGTEDAPTPGRFLAYRLDLAARVLEKSPSALCIVCGGKGRDEPVAEAEVMKRYLVARGVDEGRILVDDESANTLENIECAMKIIKENDLEDYKVACLSTEYHIPRIKFLCSKAGLSVDYYYYAASPNFFGLWSGLVREYMSYGKLLLTGHL